MTLTDLDLTVLEDLDFAPVCEYAEGCENEVVYIVWTKDPCGCKGVIVRNFCAVCYYRRFQDQLLAYIFCVVCQERWRPADVPPLMVERYSGRS